MVPSILDEFRDPNERGRTLRPTAAPPHLPITPRNQTGPASRRRRPPEFPFIAAVIAATFIACVTVLIPWLLGRNILRDTPLHQHDPSVYNVLARNDGTYFLADWSGGCILIAALASLVLIGRGLSGRWATLVLGLAGGMVLAAFWLPSNIGQWAAAEKDTQEILASTPAPSAPPSCGKDEAVIPQSGTETKFLLQAIAVKGATGLCSDIAVYKGWNHVATFNLPGSETLNARYEYVDMHLFAGASADDSWVVLSTSGSTIIGFNAIDPSRHWTSLGPIFDPPVLDYLTSGPNTTTPRTSYAGNVFMIIRALGTRQQYIEGIDPRIGSTKWTSRCADPGWLVSDLFVPSSNDMAHAGAYCMVADGMTAAKFYTVDQDGSMAVRKD